MPSNLHTRDLILRLKAVRAEKGLTLQEIFDMLDAAGTHVGITSIKKVFADGSEDLGFRYHDTIEPIAKVLLDLYDDQGDAEAVALKADLAVKDELIARLERELAECREEHARRTEFLMRQIDLKDERIDKLMDRVDQVLASNRELTQQLQKLLDKCDSCPVNRITEDQTP